MTPEKIKQVEEDFYKNLTDSSGKKFHRVSVEIVTYPYGLRDINILSPDDESYFYKETTEKKNICLHFTVGNIKSDIATLTKPNYRVSVQYIIDSSGNIYNLFPDRQWSYHLGAGAVGGNEFMSKNTIGVELSNYGILVKSGKDLLDVYGSKYCTLKDVDKYIKGSYRGKDYYASLSKEQVLACSDLIKHLSYVHSIPIKFKENLDSVFSSNTEARNFSGIYVHSSVRKDKFDFPEFVLSSLIEEVTRNEKPLETAPTVVEYKVEKNIEKTESEDNVDEDMDTLSVENILPKNDINITLSLIIYNLIEKLNAWLFYRK